MGLVAGFGSEIHCSGDLVLFGVGDVDGNVHVGWPVVGG
jgi:hypothetical protein